MSNKDKTWTAGTLKSRGWTEELLSSLLPPAQRRYFSGRRVRVWRIEDVKRAEQTEEFQKNRVKAVSSAPGQGLPVEDALAQAGKVLEQAWVTGDKGVGRAWLLAERYHRAICRQIPTVSWASRLKTGHVPYVRGAVADRRLDQGDTVLLVRGGKRPRRVRRQ